MRKHKKTIGLLLAAILLVGGTFLATMAYLTSEKEVNNTFTVGKVEIKLDEAKVDEDGRKVVPEVRQEEGNAYHILPGKVFDKDPMVTVLKGSEESYVRILMSISNQTNLDLLFPGEGLAGFFTGYDSVVWTYIGSEKVGEVRTYEFRYANTVAAPSVDMPLDPLFTQIKIPGEGLSNDDLAKLEGLEIKLVGQAIQAEGFDDADEAWAAW